MQMVLVRNLVAPKLIGRFEICGVCGAGRSVLISRLAWSLAACSVLNNEPLQLPEINDSLISWGPEAGYMRANENSRRALRRHDACGVVRANKQAGRAEMFC